MEKGILLAMLHGPPPPLGSAWPVIAGYAALARWMLFSPGLVAAAAAVLLSAPLRRALDRTYRPWFEWLCRHPLLIVMAGTIVYVSSPPDPAQPGFGVRYLFRQPEPSVQFAAGMALAMWVFELSFVGYLLDAGQR